MQKLSIEATNLIRKNKDINFTQFLRELKIGESYKMLNSEWTKSTPIQSMAHGCASQAKIKIQTQKVDDGVLIIRIA